VSQYTGVFDTDVSHPQALATLLTAELNTYGDVHGARREARGEDV
jgi:hypothetical protein